MTLTRIDVEPIELHTFDVAEMKRPEPEGPVTRIEPRMAELANAMDDTSGR